MLISVRAPAELARPADTLVILERALYHIGLLQRGVLVQRYDGPGCKLEQRRGDSAVIGVEHLDLNSGKFGRLPRHVRDIEIARGEMRGVLGLDVGMHEFAGLHGHGNPPWPGARSTSYLTR